MAIGVLAVGHYAPHRVVPSSEVATWCDASTEWISERTGVQERRYADVAEATSDLAAKALQEALFAGEVAAREVDLLVLGTCTPDQSQPAAAAHAQRKAGLGPCTAFDVNAVCSGFVFGMVLMESLLRQHPSGTIGACVGADKFSQLMDRADKRTAPLFGDGAGCALMGNVPDGYGILGSSLMTDGRAADLVTVPAGGSARPSTTETLANGDHFFKMEGREVKEFARSAVPEMVNKALRQAGLTISDVDRGIIHQGNVRLVENLGDSLGLPRGKVHITGDIFGNTAAASVPMTLSKSHERSPIQRGEIVLLASVGGGMTAGAVILRWH